MLKKALESAAAEGAETEFVLLRSKDVRMCKGCMTCEVGNSGKPGVCVIKDEMEQVLSQMLEADAFVFGTPVYFYMLSGLLKNFMDRTIPIWPLLKGKRAAGVAVAEDTMGRAIDNIRTYSDLLQLEWGGEVIAIARDPGEVAKNEGVAEMLKGLGRRLVHGSDRS
jgi:multimeric flavodoxin WrbA